MKNEDTYELRLTKNEMRMIRIALMLETDRREEMHNSKAKDYNRLTNYFNGLIKEIEEIV